MAYAVLNSAGLIDAILHGTWRMRADLRRRGICRSPATCWALGALGWLPRVQRSTRGEGVERRYFYGSVWAVCLAQPVLWLLWKVLPLTRTFDLLKLAIFWGLLAYVGNLARRGLLPRTRPILPGESAIAD